MKIKGCVIFATTVLVWLLTLPCYALEPHEILVVANRNAARSIGLAEYYMKARNIPKSNLLRLWISDKESFSREEYEKRVVPAVRKFIRENNSLIKIRCLLTIYGLPLKIKPPQMTPSVKKEVGELRKTQNFIQEQIKEAEGRPKEEIDKLKKELKDVKKRIAVLTMSDQRSSFDSELALVLSENYSLSKWIPNPSFIGFKDKNKLPVGRQHVLMVSRLYAPSEALVKRIIDDSMIAEKNGLKGVAYFDARWSRPKTNQEQKATINSAFYDRSIHDAADRVTQSSLMPAIVNDKPELFQPGEGPNAALYCGWYSLGKYVDAFKWQKAAIGYHIASAECSTLKRKDSQVWCKRMLEEGVAATLGPTSEPYLQTFPVPEIFFGSLLDGRLTLAECYALALPFLSWQMVLIGDPLYRPFMNVTRN